ncbi:MAG: acyl carrier protein [Thermoleophilaceae bacterium]|jgi:acyl carrier protein|nr:acyl carrier protein [Thermoleophilaceae bacterium]
MKVAATPKLVEEKLVDAIVELGAERDEVTRDATWEQLDIDSLDLVELAQVAEEEFGVQLRPDDMKSIETVGQAIDWVAARAS